MDRWLELVISSCCELSKLLQHWEIIVNCKCKTALFQSFFLPLPYAASLVTRCANGDDAACDEVCGIPVPVCSSKLHNAKKIYRQGRRYISHSELPRSLPLGSPSLCALEIMLPTHFCASLLGAPRFRRLAASMWRHMARLAPAAWRRAAHWRRQAWSRASQPRVAAPPVTLRGATVIRVCNTTLVRQYEPTLVRLCGGNTVTGGYLAQL